MDNKKIISNKSNSKREIGLKTLGYKAFCKTFSEKLTSNLNKNIQDSIMRFKIINLKDNKLEIVYRRTTITMSIDKIYEGYCNNLLSMNELMVFYSIYLENMKNQEYKEINTDKIFPIIKTDDFLKQKNNYTCYKNPIGSDLYTLYVEDYKDAYKILTVYDNFEELEHFAEKNLEKEDGKFLKLNHSKDIYFLDSNYYYTSSMILNKRIQEQAVDICGKNFLFIIPNEKSLLIAPNTPQYQDELYYLVNDDDINISKKVYCYANGCITEKKIDNSRLKSKLKKRIPKYIKIIK